MITTERLYIRPLEPADWQSMKIIAADFRASKYAVYDMPLPIDYSEIRELTASFAESGMFFAVIKDGEMIGYICFHEESGSYDLGFCFHSDFHGNGYAYESCSAVMKYMADNRNAAEFTAGTALQNIPSCKLLERLGFALRHTETLSFHKDENGNDIVFEGGVFGMKNIFIQGRTTA